MCEYRKSFWFVQQLMLEMNTAFESRKDLSAKI